MVSTDVEELGALDELPDLLALEVLEVVVVGGAEVGAQAAVVARDDDAALARLDLGVDAVLDAEAGLLDGVAQGGGVLVVADAAQVDDRVGRQDVLGAAGRVLRRAARDQLGVEVGQEVLEQGRVLVLGQDRVVGLEVVLVQELLGAYCLDVWGRGGLCVSLL